MKKLKRADFASFEEAYTFICPGCFMEHLLIVRGKGKTWQFNGSLEKPSFNPSLVVTTTLSEGGVVQICHSFISEGQIQFLDDCTHHLKNQTVELSDVPDEEDEKTLV